MLCCRNIPSEGGEELSGDIGVGEIIPDSLRGVMGNVKDRVSVAPATEARDVLLSLCGTIVSEAMCAVSPCPFLTLFDGARLSAENGVGPGCTVSLPFLASRAAFRNCSALALRWRLRCLDSSGADVTEAA